MGSDTDINAVFDVLQEQMVRTASDTYSSIVIEHFKNPRNIGVLAGSEAFSIMTGACGDTMEIFMDVHNGVIKKAKFNTDGCMATIACGSCITEMITDISVADAYDISAADLIKELGGLPDNHRHCALLTVLTLYSALGRYSVSIT